MRNAWQTFGRIFGAFLLLAHATASGAADAPAVAMVTDIEGKVTLFGDAGKSKIAILSDIRPDTRLQIESGGRLVAVYFASGQSYEVKGPSVVLFAAQKPEAQSGAKPVPRGSALPRDDKDVRIRPVVAAQAAFVMRSDWQNPTIKLQSPSGSLTLEERPSFSWEAVAPNLQYRFSLIDETGRPLHESSVDGTSLLLPSNIRLLEGVKYTWRITTGHPDGRSFSNAAEFKLAPGDLRRQVEKLRPAGSSPFAERVVFAAWLEQTGLRDEARKQWRALSAERSDEPRLKALAGK